MSSYSKQVSFLLAVKLCCLYTPGSAEATSGGDAVGCSDPVYDLKEEIQTPSADSGVGDDLSNE